MFFRRLCFSVPFALFVGQGCVMVQISQKENILSRTEQKTERLESRRVAAALREIAHADNFYALRFAVSEKVTVTERRHFVERVHTEKRLLGEDGRLKYFVSWISFAFEEKGAGGYFLYMLGGIPMTLGINIPVALYDWVSMPFRLRDETSERTRYEDRVIEKSEAPVPDCTRFVVRIYKVEYTPDNSCTLRVESAALEEMAARHPVLPQFPGVFRYELVDTKTSQVLMNSQIFIRNFPQRKGRIEFLERP